MLLFGCAMASGSDGDASGLGQEFVSQEPENKELIEKQTVDHLAQQRQLYSDALELMRRGKRQQFAKKQRQLKTYPLYPYLIYA